MIGRALTWVMDRLTICATGPVYLTNQVEAYRAEVAARPTN